MILLIKILDQGYKYTKGEMTTQCGNKTSSVFSTINNLPAQVGGAYGVWGGAYDVGEGAYGVWKELMVWGEELMVFH